MHASSINLQPCVMVTLSLPVSPALFVTVQLYVAKSFSAEGLTIRVLEFSESMSPVLSFLHVYVLTSGLVLVTLQKRVVEPPRLILVRDAVTSTTGGTGKKIDNLELCMQRQWVYLPVICKVIVSSLMFNI